MIQKRFGRKGFLAFWLCAGLALTSYYNGCGNVRFDQSSTARLQDMQSTAVVVINHDDTFTKSDLVDVELGSFQSNEVYVTNDSTCKSGGQWQPLTSNINWTLGAKNQQTSVYAKFRNTTEQLETGCVSDSIIHDDEPPTVLLNAPSSATNVTVPIINYIAGDTLSGLDQQFCEWPGKAPSSCLFSTSNGNLAEGRYLVKISASDKAGNVSVPVVHDLTVDRTPPVITILSGPPALSNNTAVSYGFNVQDDRSGVKSIECSWETNTAYAPCVSPIAKSFTDGPHSLYIRAFDVAGNSAESKNDFAIDMTAPSVRILTGPNDFSNSSAATFTFDGSDSGVAITRFDCRVDAGAFTNCTSPKSYSGLSEGLHSFDVRGYDGIGNLSAPAERKWYVDLTPPKITFVSTPPALSNNVNPAIKYTITDTGSGVDKSLCSVDAGAFVACPVDGMNLVGLAEGPHKFQVRATDKATNSADSTIVSFTIDLKPPTMQFTQTPGLVSNLPAFTFKFLATDDIGVDFTQCRLDAAAFVNCDSVTSHSLSGLTEGSHTFGVRAVDTAGNMGPEITYTWMVDLSGPAITYFQLPPSLTTEGAGVPIGFTVADAGSGVKTLVCKLDGSVVTCTSGVVLIFPAPAIGSHNFVVTATDNAGNISTDTKTFTVKAPVAKSQLVQVKVNNRVDVLVIMDNSGSMKDEMTNMATRIGNFTGQLAGLDWQIGIITTDMTNNNPLKDGRLVPMNGLTNTYILTSAMPSSVSQTAFSSTIQMPTNGSGAERGMQAANRAFDRSLETTVAASAPNVALFRNGAALAVVVVSDAYDDSGVKAEDVIAKVKALWPTKTFSWNSIVVPERSYTDPNATNVNPNDPCGKSRESVNYDGREYTRLSGLTGGIKGDECLADYGSQMKDMGKATADLVNSVTLDCQPVDHNNDGLVDMKDVAVTDPNGNPITAFTVQGNKLTFTNLLPVGSSRFDYYCVQ